MGTKPESRKGLVVIQIQLTHSARDGVSRWSGVRAIEMGDKEPLQAAGVAGVEVDGAGLRRSESRKSHQDIASSGSKFARAR